MGGSKMKKILGTRKHYNNQRNDATQELLSDYNADTTFVACGPNCLAEGLEIGKWPNVFTPSVQWADSIMMVLHNTHNEKYFKAIRNLPDEKYAYNEVPQFLAAVPYLLYGKKGKKVTFHFGLTDKLAELAIIAGKTLIIHEKGHYDLLTGFDDKRKLFYYDDPFRGFHKTIAYKDFMQKFSSYYVEIPKYGV